MNILQLISSSGFFGAENVVVQLLSQLARETKYSLSLGVINNLYNPHSEVAEHCRTLPISIANFTCKNKIDIKTILKIRKFLQTNHIDVIHSHGYKSNLFAFFAAGGTNTSLVATCHNWLGNDPKMKLYAILDRLILRRFAGVVGVSKEVEAKILTSGIQPHKVNLVFNGITAEKFENKEKGLRKVRSEFSIPPTHTVIGTVGRLSSEKGHELLLQTAQSIFQHYPETSFLIVGDGELKEILQRKFKSSRIIFTGMRYDLPEIYNAIDLFVLPSLTEGLPMVLLEAMASKIPVIATRVGSVPDVIEDMVSGFLIPAGSKDQLERKLLQILSFREELEKIALNGYEKVKNEFTSAIMTEKYMNIYQNIVTT